MMQDAAPMRRALHVSQSGGDPSQIQSRYIHTPIEVSNSRACRVQETFRSSSCKSGWDGRLVFHPEGKGVEKGFVENKDKQEKHFSSLP